jgi:hypothetical protein
LKVALLLRLCSSLLLFHNPLKDGTRLLQLSAVLLRGMNPKTPEANFMVRATLPNCERFCHQIQGLMVLSLRALEGLLETDVMSSQQHQVVGLQVSFLVTLLDPEKWGLDAEGCVDACELFYAKLLPPLLLRRGDGLFLALRRLLMRLRTLALAATAEPKGSPARRFSTYLSALVGAGLKVGLGPTQLGDGEVSAAQGFVGHILTVGGLEIGLHASLITALEAEGVFQLLVKECHILLYGDQKGGQARHRSVVPYLGLSGSTTPTATLAAGLLNNLEFLRQTLKAHLDDTHNVLYMECCAGALGLCPNIVKEAKGAQMPMLRLLEKATLVGFIDVLLGGTGLAKGYAIAEMTAERQAAVQSALWSSSESTRRGQQDRPDQRGLLATCLLLRQCVNVGANSKFSVLSPLCLSSPLLLILWELLKAMVGVSLVPESNPDISISRALLFARGQWQEAILPSSAAASEGNKGGNLREIFRFFLEIYTPAIFVLTDGDLISRHIPFASPAELRQFTSLLKSLVFNALWDPAIGGQAVGILGPAKHILSELHKKDVRTGYMSAEESEGAVDGNAARRVAKNKNVVHKLSKYFGFGSSAKEQEQAERQMAAPDTCWVIDAQRTDWHRAWAAFMRGDSSGEEERVMRVLHEMPFVVAFQSRVELFRRIVAHDRKVFHATTHTQTHTNTNTHRHEK